MSVKTDGRGGRGNIKTDVGNDDCSLDSSDIPSVQITPINKKTCIQSIEITDENIEVLLGELNTSSPLIKEYLKIARNCEFTSDLRFIISSNQNGIFVSVTNKNPDLYLLFRTNINLIVRSQGPDLLCTLYNYKHQIFKGMVIKDFVKYLDDDATSAGISMFLRELEIDRYRVCSGAFTECELAGGLNVDLVKSLLIEKFEGSVVYRSRDCFTLVPSTPGETAGCGTSPCECCLKLKLEMASNLSADEKAKMFGDNSDNTETALSSFVEVCMDSDEEHSQDSNNISQDNYDKENLSIHGEEIDQHFPSLSRKYQQRKVKTTKVSYKKLIISAILSSPHNMLKLTEIYEWILERYPLFNENKTGFQNSIRHNLSLNRIFVKVPTAPDYSTPGNKGSYWTIEPSELKIQKDFNTKDHDETLDNFRIKIPPKGAPRTYGKGPVEIEKKDLNISSRFIAIAPKPSNDSYFIQKNSTGQNDKKDEENDSGNLVIDEMSDAAKELPDNLKRQLKKGLPIILRPVENSSTSLPIIIQPSSVISLNSAMSSTPNQVLGVSTGASSVTLLQRPISSSQPAPATDVTVSLTGSPKVATAPNLGARLSMQFAANGAHSGTASVGSDEFPKPPFSYKELCMISIFFSATNEMGLSSIYDHVKLWFPYYRQSVIGMTWQNSIRHNLSLNKVFQRVEGGRWTFDQSDDTWKRLIVSNKWFETPVDADLFEHMAQNCPEFQQKVYSKKSMFKTVPITVKSDESDEVEDIDGVKEEEEESIDIKEELDAREIDAVVDQVIRQGGVEEEMEEGDVDDPLEAEEDEVEEMEEDLEDEDEEDPLA